MNRKPLIIFLLLLHICMPLHARKKLPTDGEYENPLVNAINTDARTQFNPQDFSWNADGFEEWVTKLLQHSINPKPGMRFAHAHLILSSFDQHIPTELSTVTDELMWKDLNLFSGQSDKTRCVANQVGREQTALGSGYMRILLASPLHGTDAVSNIAQRQKIIKQLTTDTALHEQLAAIFESLDQGPEPAFLTLYNTGMTFHGACKGMYFKVPGTKFLNSSALAMQAKALYERSETLLNFGLKFFGAAILPIYALHLFFDQNPSAWLEQHSLERRSSTNAVLYLLSLFPRVMAKIAQYPKLSGMVSLGAAGYCAANIAPAYTWMKEFALLDDKVHTKMIEVAKYLSGMKRVHALISLQPELAERLEHFHLLSEAVKTIPQHEAHVQDVLDMFATRTFQGQHSPVSYMGRVYAALYQLHEIKDAFKPALLAMAEIDTFTGIASLLREYEEKNVSYSFVQFIESDSPYIKLDNFWNPMVDDDIVVPSSVELGGQHRRNAVVTGPNAGGKSTTLKAIAINLLLAHVFGVTPSESAVITPFRYIRTYLNIVDDIGAGNSLFKSEVLRAQNLIDLASSLQPGQFCFAAFDELFSGTAPREGAAASYALAQHFGGLPQTVCMAATHFAILTDLEKNTDNFTNYRMNVDISKDGKLHYPFTLEKGICNQNIALDILKSQGIDATLIDTAQQIVAAG